MADEKAFDEMMNDEKVKCCICYTQQLKDEMFSFKDMYCCIDDKCFNDFKKRLKKHGRIKEPLQCPKCENKLTHLSLQTEILDYSDEKQKKKIHNDWDIYYSGIITRDVYYCRGTHGICNVLKVVVFTAEDKIKNGEKNV